VLYCPLQLLHSIDTFPGQADALPNGHLLSDSLHAV
jgi:hypothetical protein